VRLFLVAVLGAFLSSELLKLLFHRVRPEPFFAVYAPQTFSFPSGHSLVSPCFYGVLAAIVASRLRPPAARAAVWASAAVLAALIGCSRIYLGVHYPSDVLAGYAVAVAWAAGLFAAIEWRRRTPPRNRI
jgi:undecaprenyl-diphosphatase